MATKPETTFIKGVHKYVTGMYFMKNNNPYLAGIPDVWYSGFVRDLWIEYKYLPKPPAFIVPDLSPQQLRWIRMRKLEGRDIWTIVGMPAGGIVIKDYDAMLEGVSLADYDVLSRKELGAYIFNFCNQEPS